MSEAVLVAAGGRPSRTAGSTEDGHRLRHFAAVSESSSRERTLSSSISSQTATVLSFTDRHDACSVLYRANDAGEEDATGSSESRAPVDARQSDALLAHAGASSRIKGPRRVATRLVSVLKSPYVQANAVYVVYAVGMLAVDFALWPAVPSPDPPGPVGVKGGRGQPGPRGHEAGLGYSRYTAALDTVNHAYALLAGVHVLNAIQYVLTWLGHAPSPAADAAQGGEDELALVDGQGCKDEGLAGGAVHELGFSVEMEPSGSTVPPSKPVTRSASASSLQWSPLVDFSLQRGPLPDWLNVVGALLYAAAAALYPLQDEVTFSDPTTHAVRGIELAAGLVEVLAACLWASQWVSLRSGILGRLLCCGGSLGEVTGSGLHANPSRCSVVFHLFLDLELWANVFTLAPALLYLVFAVRTCADTTLLATDKTYEWADIGYAVGAVAFLAGSIRDGIACCDSQYEAEASSSGLPVGQQQEAEAATSRRRAALAEPFSPVTEEEGTGPATLLLDMPVSLAKDIDAPLMVHMSLPMFVLGGTHWQQGALEGGQGGVGNKAAKMAGQRSGRSKGKIEAGMPENAEKGREAVVRLSARDWG